MLFDRPWGRPPVENCIASCSNSGLTSGCLPFCGQGHKYTHCHLFQKGRRYHSSTVSIAAPEKEAKGKQSINGDKKPMIYEKERVEYGDGAVTKASNDLIETFLLA